MQTQFDTKPLYPRSQSFLIQFHRDADIGAGRCIGRIEHISALGVQRNFFSVHELFAFLEESLASGECKECGKE